MEFSPRVNEDNPDPRIACALLLDTSSSMSGAPIDQLNRGFELFCDEIKKDDLAKTEAARGVSVFAIGVGSGANLIRLKELSTRRDPVKLDGLSFSEFFAWLSASLSAASASNAFGSSDAGVAQAETGEQIPLPPATGWATA